MAAPVALNMDPKQIQLGHPWHQIHRKSSPVKMISNNGHALLFNKFPQRIPDLFLLVAEQQFGLIKIHLFIWIHSTSPGISMAFVSGYNWFDRPTLPAGIPRSAELSKPYPSVFIFLHLNIVLIYTSPFSAVNHSIVFLMLVITLVKS